MSMRISVVVITKDEHPRLRLCLLALARQTVRWGDDAEVIIVDDGSATPVGASEIPSNLPSLRILRNFPSRGRSASRNQGAAAARGDRLLFLDGDVILSPQAVARHAALTGLTLGRGEQRHLRGTRFFADPRTGEAWPGKEGRVGSLGDLRRHLLTEEMIVAGSFEAIVASSDFAIYPGAAPRKLWDLEMRALRDGSAPLAEWMAAAGHNFSFPREKFLEHGGFDEALSINEHRELALRLSRIGSRMVVVDEAISIHITHREGWRDPLSDEDGWERTFAGRHPRETEVMTRFWRTLAGDSRVAAESRVTSLEQADAILREAALA
jgi:glycosyltransferase involved in cell wall biosynthesis